MTLKFGSKCSAISSLNNLKEWSLQFIGLIIFSNIKTLYKYFIFKIKRLIYRYFNIILTHLTAIVTFKKDVPLSISTDSRWDWQFFVVCVTCFNNITWFCSEQWKRKKFRKDWNISTYQFFGSERIYKKNSTILNFSGLTVMAVLHNNGG